MGDWILEGWKPIQQQWDEHEQVFKRGSERRKSYENENLFDYSCDMKLGRRLGLHKCEDELT